MQNIAYTRLAGDWYLHADTCPVARIMQPACNHCVIDVKEDGTFKSAKELSVQGHQMQIHDITGTFAGENAGIDIAGKMHIGMNLLDSDYDNYAIFYQCFENISQVQPDKTLKPVHSELVAIAHRNANLGKVEYKKLLDRVLTKATDLTAKDFTRFKSGDAEQCEYTLKQSDLWAV